ncbi:pimeloyl-ACP methyl ester carboxylesterase [Nocardioides albertanoniae]|uniref:Pimeloyl-ACP methyl ester carboxylesterase n=1 Tax=Nocardioides albertanoniae TaxID=1175486 RepID=A0A543AA39_9ACTN|nr:alpha/beta hydrolase [Nocardioides albertanoniae]TQL69468.1 pimeloyl-ACP methyl ester carboxylesterase [Nocardioides albertanoniae]
MLTTLLDGRAFGEKHGKGAATVVALHGWARNRSDWGSTLDGLDALALDQPGFGATPAPDEAWNTRQYAEWLAEILRDLDRPVLVGHSFGGRVAVQLAAAHPELVRGLVITGLPLFRPKTGGKPKLAYRIGRWAYAKKLISESRMDGLREKYGSSDYRNAKGVMREVLVKAVNDDYTEQLESVAATDLPVKLVWGENDTAAPSWMPDEAMAILGDNATLEIVPGSAHLLDAGLVKSLRVAIDDLRTN